MKQTVYKFDSKHLAKAFMDELLDMGYHGGHYSPEGCNYILDNFALLGKKRVDYNQEPLGNGIEFQLETQWNEALEFAKGQIEADKEPEFTCDNKDCAHSNKFSRGDWVKVKHFGNDFISKIKKPVNNGLTDIAYGFNANGHWIDGGKVRLYSRMEKATKEEIEQALGKEWAKRCKEAGWDDPDGVEFDCVEYGDTCKTDTDGYKYYAEHDWLFSGDGFVYSSGRWATPKQEKYTTFFDWEVEQSIGEYKIGYSIFNRGYLSDVMHDLEEIHDAQGNVTISKVIEQLGLILTK